MRRILAAVVLACTLLAACGTSNKTSTADRASTTTVAAKPLHILVTNDDGYAAAGIDALVEALRGLPNTTVTVIAPAKNQSGVGGKTTPGMLDVTDVTTASGYPAQAVDGYPADAVVYTLDQHGMSGRPDLVIAGINEGQNLGVLLDISGTMGAARAAAQRGVPALAVSQGIVEKPRKPDYPAGVRATLAWIAKHRSSLSAPTVTNLNIPTCPAGEPRTAVVVPVDPARNGFDAVDCVTPFVSPQTDVDAFLHGYVAQTDDVPLQAGN